MTFEEAKRECAEAGYTLIRDRKRLLLLRTYDPAGVNRVRHRCQTLNDAVVQARLLAEKHKEN